MIQILRAQLGRGWRLTQTFCQAIESLSLTIEYPVENGDTRRQQRHQAARFGRGRAVSPIPATTTAQRVSDFLNAL